MSRSKQCCPRCGLEFRRQNAKMLNQYGDCILARWLDWARAHGHLNSAEGLVRDTREALENASGDGREV